MAITYEPIATTTLSTATASVTFSSIPQTYTDLLIIGQLGQSASNNSVRYRYNSDSGSNYSYIYIKGVGTSAGSGTEANATSGYITETSGDSGLNCIFRCNILNYTNTTTYKTLITRSGRANELADLVVSTWRNTSAITSISIAQGASFPTNNLISGSTFTLYGIKAA